MTEKVVLKIKLTIVEYRRHINIGIYIGPIFSYGRDIASCLSTKQSHLGRCSNGKLLTSTLVNDGTLRSTADFASALSNVKMLIIKEMLKYLICSRFL